MRTKFSLVPSLFLFLFAGSAAAQTDLERATAREAADAGRTAFEAGHYEQAVDSFTRAEQLVHAPPHLLFLARSQAKLGRLVAAHENYLKIIHETLPAKAPKAFLDAQSSADQELEKVDARLPSVTIAVQGTPTTGVGVQMDGAELSAAMIGIPLPVDPGQHVFKASATGAESAPVTLTLAEGAKETVMLTLRPTASAPVAAAAQTTTSGGSPADNSSSSNGAGLRVASYVSFGVGAVGLGLGTYYLLKSSSTRNSANSLYDSCLTQGGTGQCDDPVAKAQITSKDSDADSQRTLGAGALVVGGVGIATGVTLLVLDASHRRSTASATKPHVTPVFGFRSVGLLGTF